MKRHRTILIATLVVSVGIAAIAARFWLKRTEGLTVTAEPVRKRDLEAIVSASGKIQPKRSVNISADTMGRVTNLAVNEGDRVKTGQFLLQIDPKSLRTRVESGEAALQAARSSLQQLRQAVETARAQLQLARDNLKRQQDLWREQLTTREAFDRAANEVTVRESDLKEREQQVRTQELRIDQERAALQNARYDLSKVRIESPIDGIVTRRNIEEGETVVVGTMNNPGTVLLTLADLSVIEAEVEVDETDIPSVRLGQPAKVTIDALPDQSFIGHVTEIGNSPMQPGGVNASAGRQATNFKVKVTIAGQIPEVRPGFTCTADITTATRGQVLTVPIQAVTVREVVLNAAGQIVREPRAERGWGWRSQSRSVEPRIVASELGPGQVRKELEGVFLIRNDRAAFVPTKVGIAGEKYFEVLSGPGEGSQVITGPFSSVREMADGEPVQLQQPKDR